MSLSELPFLLIFKLCCNPNMTLTLPSHLNPHSLTFPPRPGLSPVLTVESWRRAIMWALHGLFLPWVHSTYPIHVWGGVIRGRAFLLRAVLVTLRT